MGLSRTKMLAGIQSIMIDVFNDVINKPKYEQKTNSLYQNKIKQIADLANKTLKTTLSLKIVIKGFFIEFEVSITKIIDELTNKLFTDVDPPKRSRFYSKLLFLNTLIFIFLRRSSRELKTPRKNASIQCKTSNL